MTGLFGQALDFYGLPISQVFVNTNGNITFTQPIGQFNPTPLGASTAFAIIAGGWADLDTRAGVVAPSAGGNSTGSNLLYWDLDDTTQTFTATWDDVANYSFGNVATVAFQLQLVGRGNDDFDIIYRYEFMDASRARRAGFANQNDTAIFELPGSGTAATGNLDTLIGNTGLPGVWRFSVRDGAFTPTASADAYATNEDTQLVVAGPGVLGNDADPLGRPLTAVLSTGPARGTVAFNTDGSFTYTPNTDFNGTDSFTYQAVADTLGSGATTVTITVNGTNDAPRNIFINDNSTPENLVSGVNTGTGVVVGTLSAFDPESPIEQLGFALVDDAGGRFVLDGRVLKTAGVLNYEDATFQDIVVRVTDPQGAAADQTIRIFVDNVNEGPQALSFAGGAIDENAAVGTLVGTLYAEDPDGDEVYFTIVSGQVTVDDEGRVYTAIEFDYEDQASVTFVARATALGDSIAQPFSFAINDVNEEPTANDDQADTLVNEAVTIDATQNDEDEDSFGIPVIVSVGPAGRGTAVQTGGFTIQYTPEDSFVGTDSFTYTISDGEFESTATITVTVRPGDVVAVPDDYYIAEDSTNYPLEFIGNDYRVLPDGTQQDSIEAGLMPYTVYNPQFGELQGVSGSNIGYYTAPLNFYGVDQIQYSSSDGYSPSLFTTITINVVNVNDDPYQIGAYGQSSGRFDAVENQVLTQVLDFDQIVLDLDTVVYDGVTPPAQFILVDQQTYTTSQGGTLELTSSFGTYSFTYTPPQDFAGTDTVAITYNDYEYDQSFNAVPVGGNHTAELTFLVEERTPVARADTYTTDIGFFVLGNVLSNDRSPAGLALRVADFGGEFDIAENGAFSFVSAASGTYTGDYYAEDTEGNFTEIVTVTVVVRPEPLYAYPISYTAYIWGDPHLVTYDGLSYDFQGYGEFVLTRAAAGSAFEVQVRTSPWYDGAQVTIVEAVAAKIGDHTIMLDTAGSLLVDGVARTVAQGGDPLNLSGNVALFRLANGEYVFVDKTSGDQVRVAGVGGSYLNVNLGLSEGRAGDMQGLLGDTNGSTTNDLQLVDGTVLSQPLDFFTLYGDYADAWRVTDATSLFVYAPGQGTADFQVADFPPAPVRIGDLPTAAVAAAAQIVAAAGITDPLLAEAAILDLLLTGDEQFIAGAAAGQDPETGLVVFVPPTPPLIGLLSPMGDVTEGDAGVTTLTFTVFRTGNGLDEVSVDWAVQAVGLGFTSAADHGGALPGGTVTLLAGELEKTFTVDVTGDLVAELNEEVRVALTATPAGYTVASATAQQTVLNDDGPLLPDAVDDAVATGNAVPVVIRPLDNDTDPVGAGLAITGNSAAAHGTLQLTGNLFTYTPDAGFSGQDSFTYTIQLAGGGTDTATVTIDVAAAPPAPNALPTAGTDTAYGPFGAPIVLLVADLLANDNDPENATLTITGISLAGTNGVAVLDAAGGTVTYTPDAGFSGTDTFSYFLSDGTGTTLGIVNVTVAASAVNAAPTANDDTATGNEDSVLAGNVLGNDTDANGDPLSATLLAQATNGVVALNPDGSFTYTPGPNFNGSDAFSYSVSDGTLSDTGTVQLTVNAVNDEPIANPETVTADEGSPTVLDVLANDTDGDGDTLTVVDFAVFPTFGSVGIVGNQVVYTANPDAGGQQDFFRYVVNDGQGGAAQGDVTITIGDLADAPPVANDDDATTDEDTPIVVAVLANDLDDGVLPLTVAIVTGPANGTATVTANGAIEYAPNANFFGADTVEYTVTDDTGLTDTATLTITIDPLNDDPTGLALSSNAVPENSALGTVVGTLSATDADGDPLSFGIVGAAGPFSVVGNQLLVNGPLDFETLAAHPLTLSASDGNGGIATLPVIITVTDVNEGGPVEYGVRFSNNSVGLGLAPAGPFTGPGGNVSITQNTAFGTLIENAGSWNSVKNAVGQGGWNAALGDVITVANFVDVRLDFTNALDRDLTVNVIGAKRGGASLAEAGLVTGAGDDSVTWVFHSNEAGWTNTAAIRAGAGNDTVSISDVLRSTLDNALLADNAAPGNGSFWRGGYDGRFSTATVDGGTGDDTISVAAASLAKLVALGGAGNDTITGGAGADDLAGGDDNDLLTGNLGADRFRFDGSDGTDQIADFSATQGDKVVLAGNDALALVGSSFSFGTTSVTASNGHVWTAADFLFA